jgi:putative transposase
MDSYESLSHTKWECKYHVVFIPKSRKKVLYGQLRRELGPVFRELAERTECRIEEGHLMIDHVHMLIAIPPKISVAAAMGFIKGKSAIHIARVYAEVHAVKIVESCRVTRMPVAARHAPMRQPRTWDRG